MPSADSSPSTPSEIAVPLFLPMQADSIASPEIRYAVGEPEETTCIVVWLSDEPDCVCKITFEGFDSIRCSRGEYLPYAEEDTLLEGRRYPWAFEINESRWLRERHEYEMQHYDTPLLEEYIHYLFSFHDEYVELISKGIWLEKIPYEQISSPPGNHPLYDTPVEVEAEDFDVAGISCQVRHNKLPREKLVEDSQLCSQKLFQYYVTLEGTTSSSYAALVRTIRGHTQTHFRGGLFYPDKLTVEGVADELKFRPAFTKYVEEVAARRREMGKS